MSKLLAILCFSAVLNGEVYTLTLKQAVNRALSQNPDIAIARLDEQKAIQAVRLAKDPFATKVGVGSGLAYSNGFPLSIEGSAPAAVQARVSQFLFNRPQTYVVAQAKENVRTAGFAAGSKRDEVAFRTASLYLDAERAERLRAMVDKEVEGLSKVAQAVRGRVQEGRELPVASKQADLDILRARQRSQTLADDRDAAEQSLAIVLGYTAADRVRASEEERTPPAAPESEQAAVVAAMGSNQELKRLESALIAKGLEARGAKAARLPRVDLVAQYAFLTKYSHYDEYFQKFQRHNGQVGASIQIPLLPGPAASAQAAQAEDDAARLRVEMAAARNRIAMDVHQSFQEIQKAEMAGQVARADLDVARELLSILLAQMQEGRAALKQVEEARFAEDEKWIAFYDAQFAAERAKYNLLSHTGELSAALR